MIFPFMHNLAWLKQLLGIMKCFQKSPPVMCQLPEGNIFQRFASFYDSHLTSKVDFWMLRNVYASSRVWVLTLQVTTPHDACAWKDREINCPHSE